MERARKVLGWLEEDTIHRLFLLLFSIRILPLIAIAAGPWESSTLHLVVVQLLTLKLCRNEAIRNQFKIPLDQGSALPPVLQNTYIELLSHIVHLCWDFYKVFVLMTRKEAECVIIVDCANGLCCLQSQCNDLNSLWPTYSIPTIIPAVLWHPIQNSTFCFKI